VNWLGKSKLSRSFFSKLAAYIKILIYKELSKKRWWHGHLCERRVDKKAFKLMHSTVGLLFLMNIHLIFLEDRMGTFERFRKDISTFIADMSHQFNLANYNLQHTHQRSVIIHTASSQYLHQWWIDKKSCKLALRRFSRRVLMNGSLIFMVNTMSFSKIIIKDFTTWAWAHKA